MSVLLKRIPCCSCRFPQMFPDKQSVHTLQMKLDRIIHSGVRNIVQHADHSEPGKDTLAQRIKVSAMC